MENTVNGPVNDFSERTPRPPACSLRGLKAACEGALVGHAENNTIQSLGFETIQRAGLLSADVTTRREVVKVWCFLSSSVQIQ